MGGTQRKTHTSKARRDFMKGFRQAVCGKPFDRTQPLLAKRDYYLRRAFYDGFAAGEKALIEAKETARFYGLEDIEND